MNILKGSQDQSDFFSGANIMFFDDISKFMIKKVSIQ